ncbi:protein NO VEIN isoform X2 [Oryza brachyantha]|nr:protein NO VEIN isoform X2 [Oryza brachyantha]
MIPKLSSEEIIKWLQKFMDSSKKKITVENFLDYLAEQNSISGKENLGVRIQSLRLHISFLRQARRTEVSAVKIQGTSSGSCDNSHEKDLVKNRKFHLSKQALDERFSAITSRIKKLPGINKHIRFDSTDDETDGNSSSECDAVENSNSKHGCAAIDNKDVDKRVSSCPYPSKTEEMERLGLKSEVSKKPPLDSNKVKESGKKGYMREKRKSEENRSPSSMCKQPKKKQKVQMQKQELLPNCSLNIGKLEKFITTWKEACHEHPVEQVLELLANYYVETPKEKKKIIKFFSKYPGIGFLNVAVRAMGCGLLDSLYDAINVFNENKSSSSIADTTTELMEVEPPPSKKKSKCVAKEANDSNDGSKDPGFSVTTDDVIGGITEFFESNHGVSRADALQGGKSTFLRMLINCETFITAKFSASQFSALGHGTFLEFLGKHEQHLPPKLSPFLKEGKFVPSSVEVSVLQQQIEVLLCQAEGNWLEDGGFSEDSFSMLLKRQFPTIGFDIVQNKSGEGLLESIERRRKNIQTNNIMFSMSLLEKRWSGIVQGNHDTVDGLMNDVQQSCSVTVSSQEAIKCLLKAPMLSDLLAWSHWDLLFAPSLGSFIHWLLNTGPVQDLACIVTTDGRFIRVDPSATIDQYLEGIIQCSPFQVAAKLLSLLHIYNGSTNTPISLLKCYAQRAIGIIMDNGNDLLNTNSEGKSFSARNIRSDMPTDVHDTVHLVAKFILDCLGHLPSEFRSLAADILLAGLRTITKNCYSAILHEATETGQLCMLHDIGLSLGVAEWAEDCRRLCLTDEIHAKAEIHASSRYPSDASGVATCENNLLNATDVDITNERGKSLSGKENQIVAVSKNQNILNLVTTKLDTAESNANQSPTMGEVKLEEATQVIETIRREEFGLDQSLSYTDNSLLKKQHARLGRALHCLSQELYSQDSHLLLELVQNADDNTYLEGVEPTLAFILQDNGIVVLNNESGFSAENIRALCDVGNSTKKGSNQGYIGNKGIGFKSVFRVTDAPEIHSNGFHVKFDITEGQIGFVLPTAVAPYNTYSVSRMLSVEDDKNSPSFWNTCIVLPFRAKFREGTGMHSIASMFSDLHPSLLLFLHRLKCIKFKNMMNDTLLVMRRKALGNGIVRISHGNDIMSWLVVSKKLQGTIVRHDVCSTEIAVAFTLQETQKGEYEPYLKLQPVFAYLPLRNYGLKFIVQGDFVLPSSREEVDADNAWNQWLLSEFPSLFVSAQESFCALPFFQSCPGKAVTTFMSFVPLVGEVHGFFCQLPHLILSKLRLTRCLVLEGSSLQWVYPCNTLRGWDEQTRILFSDSLLQEHLGLGYLSKDIIISDTLSRALGIHDYGPKVLIDIMSSICGVDGCIESLGLEWLCAWFIALHLSLMYHSSRNPSSTASPEDLLCALRKIPCIPLSNGSFSSIADGPIWLPYDVLNSKPDSKSSMLNFPVLYSNLRIINPQLLSVSGQNKYLTEEMRANDLMDILLKMGLRKLSGHDIIKNHILVSLSSDTEANMANTMMIEYVSFVMLHFQSPCASCNFEKEEIMSELRRRPILLTNHGYKCPSDEPIHFSKEYGNSVDISKLLLNVEIKWIEIDSCYLMNRRSDSLPPLELKKWRQFFEEMGVTDFVQVVKVEKNISQAGSFVAGRLSQGHNSGAYCTVYDWESPELASILSTFSSKECRENCVYLLEVLDKFWDAHYSAKAKIHTDVTHSGETIAVESSFMNSIQSLKWIASAMDEDLHYPTDLFYNTEDVSSILGSVAPYAVPQICSRSLAKDIGFKMKVSYSDALMILKSWIASQNPFTASMDQMFKFYTFVSEGFAAATIDIKQEFLSCFSIFTPLKRARSSDPVAGKFLSPKDLYWHDPTGCSEIITEKAISMKMSMFPRRMLSSTYPSLCEFFTEACGVPKVPKTSDYVDILLGLSNAALPSQVTNQVFRVFARWANDLHSANGNMNDILFLKGSLQKLETTILPTLGDKWVSLHPSFGLVCWVDDNELKQHVEDYNGVDFIQFGELSYEDNQMLYGRLAALMKSLGIPALSKVVYREAIFYGTMDNREKVTLISLLLSYMQRYIYKMHRDTYINFQQNEITKLINLQVIIVEKLFHKYKLKGRESSSNRRFKCNCLLQGNILYATQEADSHSLFLELSRLFFDGSADLHFANFLHMVKTMADSGTTAEQIESFIVNNQNVPDLPEQEAVWSFSSLVMADQDVDCQKTECPSVCDSKKTEFRSTCELNISKYQRMSGVASSWPPNDWRTAPDFITSHNNQYASVQETNLNNGVPSLDLTKVAECENSGYVWGPVELEGDWITEEDLGSENTVLAERIVATGDEPHMMMSNNSANVPTYLDLETGSSANSVVDIELTEFNDKLANVSKQRDRLCIKAPDTNEVLQTGRRGEAAAHQYFVDIFGSNNVRWVNQDSETGLPYDIVITHKEGFTEYVEVKATKYCTKEWFHITSREWQFALEKGDSSSIAYVVFSGTKKARFLILKNPYKLCQQKSLHLALVMSESVMAQQRGETKRRYFEGNSDLQTEVNR